MPVEWDAEPFEIGFEPRFLRDALATTPGELVTIRMNEPARRILVEDAEGDGSGYHLLIPVRLSAATAEEQAVL